MVDKSYMTKNEFLVALKSIKGVGNKISLDICDEFFNDNINQSELLSYMLFKYPKLNINEKVIEDAFLKAKNVLLKNTDNDIRLVSYYDDLYPRKLKILKNPPAILYYRGNIDLLNARPTLAIIGTREPTVYGMEIARMYSKYFSEQGFNIVSGLAEGIDGISQQSVVDSKGYTAAFLAQGLGTPIYPNKNKMLADKIIENGGALITEYSIDEKPNRFYFVERDRLQSGSSDAVLVIETDVTGGTMHAVNSMIELKRKLGVLDHPQKFIVNNPKSNGNQMLIKNGSAAPLFLPGSLEAFTKEVVEFFMSNEEAPTTVVNNKSITENIDLTKNNEISKSIEKSNKNGKKKVAKNQIGFDDDLFRN
jgi:DNA processing protein